MGDRRPTGVECQHLEAGVGAQHRVFDLCAGSARVPRERLSRLHDVGRRRRRTRVPARVAGRSALMVALPLVRVESGCGVTGRAGTEDIVQSSTGHGRRQVGRLDLEDAVIVGAWRTNPPRRVRNQAVPPTAYDEHGAVAEWFVGGERMPVREAIPTGDQDDQRIDAAGDEAFREGGGGLPLGRPLVQRRGGIRHRLRRPLAQRAVALGLPRQEARARRAQLRGNLGLGNSGACGDRRLDGRVSARGRE